MKWLALLVWDTGRALDWTDEQDPAHYDHGKVVADLILFSLTFATCRVAIQSHTFPPAFQMMLLIGGGMGSRVFMAIIKRWRGSSTEDVRMRFGGSTSEHDPGTPLG